MNDTILLSRALEALLDAYHGCDIYPSIIKELRARLDGPPVPSSPTRATDLIRDLRDEVLR